MNELNNVLSSYRVNLQGELHSKNFGMYEKQDIGQTCVCLTDFRTF